MKMGFSWKNCNMCNKRIYRYTSSFTCFDCLRKITNKQAGKHRQKYPLQLRAAAIVAHAKKTGVLIPLSSLKCVDCGNDAQAYDHRDYRKPLDVEPVCMSCNSKRGPAKPYIGVQNKEERQRKKYGRFGINVQQICKQ